MLGEKAAMACTVAVEEVIDQHYADQARQLGEDEAELRQTSMQSLLGVPPAMSEVKEAYCRAVDDVFGWQLAPMRQVAFSQVEPELGL